MNTTNFLLLFWPFGDGQLAHLAWYIKAAILTPPITALIATSIWAWRNW